MMYIYSLVNLNVVQLIAIISWAEQMLTLCDHLLGYEPCELDSVTRHLEIEWLEHMPRKSPTEISYQISMD